MFIGIRRTAAEDAAGPQCTSLSRSRNPCPRAACVSKRGIIFRERNQGLHRSLPWAGFRQPARQKAFLRPDESPSVIIIVDPLARRVRETEAHVMLLVESSERDKVATATVNQPLVPACANGRLSRDTRLTTRGPHTAPGLKTKGLLATAQPLQKLIRRACRLRAAQSCHF